MNAAPRTVLAELIDCGRSLVGRGWVLGQGGNLSARADDVVYVTARGASLDRLTADDFVAVDLPTGQVLASGRPSSELPMHLVAYHTCPDARAVIHAHPPYAITCGVVGLAVPALTPDFFIHVGDQVPLVAYCQPGSQALSAAVARGLAQAPAVLLQNHGMLAVGRQVDQALQRTGLIEEAARILLAAHATGLPLRVLSDSDRAELLAIRYAVQKMP